MIRSINATTLPLKAVAWRSQNSASARNGSRLHPLRGKECALEVIVSEKTLERILFSGVEAYKVSYMFTAMLPDEVDAYDRLVDLGKTEWLEAVIQSLKRHGTDTTELRHLAIELDDGPTYEVLCRGFHAEVSRTPVDG